MNVFLTVNNEFIHRLFQIVPDCSKLFQIVPDRCCISITESTCITFYFRHVTKEIIYNIATHNDSRHMNIRLGAQLILLR